MSKKITYSEKTTEKKQIKSPGVEMDPKMAQMEISQQYQTEAGSYS